MATIVTDVEVQQIFKYFADLQESLKERKLGVAITNLFDRLEKAEQQILDLRQEKENRVKEYEAALRTFNDTVGRFFATLERWEKL